MMGVKAVYDSNLARAALRVYSSIRESPTGLRNAGRFAILAVLSLPTVLSADHLPESQLARGKDELILAGIEIYKTPLDTVFRELGKPTEQRQLYPATKEVVGERVYKWKRANISVELGTEFSNEPIFNGNMRETPSSVEVKGTDGAVGHTGRGLKLGILSPQSRKSTVLAI